MELHESRLSSTALLLDPDIRVSLFGSQTIDVTRDKKIQNGTIAAIANTSSLSNDTFTVHILAPNMTAKSHRFRNGSKDHAEVPKTMAFSVYSVDKNANQNKNNKQNTNKGLERSLPNVHEEKDHLGKKVATKGLANSPHEDLMLVTASTNKEEEVPNKNGPNSDLDRKTTMHKIRNIFFPTHKQGYNILPLKAHSELASTLKKAVNSIQKAVAGYQKVGGFEEVPYKRHKVLQNGNSTASKSTNGDSKQKHVFGTNVKNQIQNYIVNGTIYLPTTRMHYFSNTLQMIERLSNDSSEIKENYSNNIKALKVYFTPMSKINNVSTLNTNSSVHQAKHNKNKSQSETITPHSSNNMSGDGESFENSGSGDDDTKEEAASQPTTSTTQHVLNRRNRSDVEVAGEMTSQSEGSQVKMVHSHSTDKNKTVIDNSFPKPHRIGVYNNIGNTIRSKPSNATKGGKVFLSPNKLYSLTGQTYSTIPTHGIARKSRQSIGRNRSHSLHVLKGLYLDMGMDGYPKRAKIRFKQNEYPILKGVYLNVDVNHVGKRTQLHVPPSRVSKRVPFIYPIIKEEKQSVSKRQKKLFKTTNNQDHLDARRLSHFFHSFKIPASTSPIFKKQKTGYVDQNRLTLRKDLLLYKQASHLNFSPYRLINARPKTYVPHQMIIQRKRTNIPQNTKNRNKIQTKNVNRLNYLYPFSLPSYRRRNKIEIRPPVRNKNEFIRKQIGQQFHDSSFGDLLSSLVLDSDIRKDQSYRKTIDHMKRSKVTTVKNKIVDTKHRAAALRILEKPIEYLGENDWSKQFSILPTSTKHSSNSERREKTTLKHRKSFIFPAFHPHPRAARHHQQVGIRLSSISRLPHSSIKYDENDEDIVEIEHPIESFVFHYPKSNYVSHHRLKPSDTITVDDGTHVSVSDLKRAVGGIGNEDQIVSYLIASPSNGLQQMHHGRNSFRPKQSVNRHSEIRRNGEMLGNEGRETSEERNNGKRRMDGDYYFEVVSDKKPLKALMAPQFLKKNSKEATAENGYVLEIDE